MKEKRKEKAPPNKAKEHRGNMAAAILHAEDQRQGPRICSRSKDACKVIHFFFLGEEVEGSFVEPF